MRTSRWYHRYQAPVQNVHKNNTEDAERVATAGSLNERPPPRQLRRPTCLSPNNDTRVAEFD